MLRNQEFQTGCFNQEKAMTRLQTRTTILVVAMLAVTFLAGSLAQAQPPVCKVKAGCGPRAAAAKCPVKAPKCAQCTPGKMCAKCTAAKADECEKARAGCLKNLNAAIAQVAVARQAVGANDKAAALAALVKIEAKLQAIQAQANKCVKASKCVKCTPDKTCPKCVATKAKKCPLKASAAKPAVVNTTCPLMGSRIDPAKVPANLYRQYKGKGVGFCCGGCPLAWDKLSDAEKDAKLKKATQQ